MARSPVRFINHGVKFSFPNKKKLKNFIIRLFKAEGKNIGDLTYIFCTDRYLLDLNRKYLNHSTLTDIITFPIIKTPLLHADVYISIKRVKHNAKLYKTSFEKELQRVIFHGALHLCGYNDKTLSEKKKMRIKETELIFDFERFT